MIKFFQMALTLSLLTSSSWAEDLIVMDEPPHSQRELRRDILQAKANVQYAQEALQEAQESLNNLQEQRPVLAGNNDLVVDSQLATYQLALQAREDAVRVARANLKEAELELQGLEQGRGSRHHRRPKEIEFNAK